MWYRAAAIGDPRVCKTVNSESSAGGVKRVVFCLQKLSDTFPSDILISLCRYLATEPRRSRGYQYPGVDLVSEGGGANVD